MESVLSGIILLSYEKVSFASILILCTERLFGIFPFKNSNSVRRTTSTMNSGAMSMETFSRAVYLLAYRLYVSASIYNFHIKLNKFKRLQQLSRLFMVCYHLRFTFIKEKKSLFR